VYPTAGAKLAKLRTPKKAPKGLDCPSAEVWLKLAGGLLSTADTERYITHAATCDHCGPILREIVHDFEEPVTDEEKAVLAGLTKLSSIPQLKSVTRVIPPKPVPQPRRWFQLPAWQLSSAGALILAIVSFTLYRVGVFSKEDTIASVNRLLAQAYTEQRTIEPRIPGAKYAPMRVEREPGGSNLNKPPVLLKAEALISERLQKKPNDPAWLEAKARADLLDGKYVDAIKSLQLALLSKPDSPELLTDIGSAYFQKGDYGNAVEWFGKALARSPNDSVALFNHALACEKLFLYTQAIEDWQRYLRIDDASEWAGEARKNLNEIEKKVNQKITDLRKPLLDPSQIASSIANENLLHEVDSRVEDYLHVAVKEWLPKEFSSYDAPKESHEIGVSLTVLADITLKNHQDSWLKDVLTGPHDSNFIVGIDTLSKAVAANDNGDYLAGRNLAHEAASLFRISGNIASYLRAKTEELYSVHLLYEGKNCISLVQRLSSLAAEYNYPWLHAQISLEESNCAGLTGYPGETRIAVDRGTRLAREHHYFALFLRGLGFQSDAAASLGDTQRGFSLALEGLETFWSSQVDLMKGYNLYTDLDTAADVLHLAHLQVAVWDQATTLIDMHPDLVQRAMAHRWFGNSAYLAEIPSLAEREFARASDLFNAAPQTEATLRDQLDAEIWLAKLETRQGDLDAASARLQQLKRELDAAPSFGTEIGFYSTQAEIDLRKQKYDDADSALRSAIFFAEWALRSFISKAARRQWAEQVEPAYRNLVALKLHQGDVDAALELWEWYKGAEYRTTKYQQTSTLSALDLTVLPDAYSAPPIYIPDVVAARAPDLNNITMITYTTLLDGIAVWIYDDRGVFENWIAKSPAEVDKLVTQFYRLCATPNSDRDVLRATSRSLYDLLITPVESRFVAGRTLVFELDRGLSSLPIEALLDPRGHYLIERASIAVTSGFYEVLRKHPIRPITREMSALSVSVPRPIGDGFIPLVEADSEAQIVADTFRRSRWLRGSFAGVNAIRHDLRRSEIFHFVGHAAVLPEMSGLALAEIDPQTGRPRFFDAESIRPETVQHLQLAVFSACNTGASSASGGSGTEGLTQSMLRSGVPHVVASRWSVDSTQTLAFMNLFYQHLVSDGSVTDALRLAQLGLALQPSAPHPYYWAAFGVQI
jgi:CHAT domain-containing protein/tetratricopeptide (TPR) repeat protein